MFTAFQACRKRFVVVVVAAVAAVVLDMPFSKRSALVRNWQHSSILGLRIIMNICQYYQHAKAIDRQSKDSR